MIVSDCCSALPYPEVYENMGKCSKCKEDSIFYEEDEFDEDLEEELEIAQNQVEIAKDALKFLSGHPTRSLNYKYIADKALREISPEDSSLVKNNN